IYQVATKAKVPVYLGSSFAYITAMQIAIQQMGGDISAAQTGVFISGIVYILVAIAIHFAGTNWIDKLLPPIVIGPMIMVIGLGLSSSADRKSTRLNSSHVSISYAVFCLKTKNTKLTTLYESV